LSRIGVKEALTKNSARKGKNDMISKTEKSLIKAIRNMHLKSLKAIRNNNLRLSAYYYILKKGFIKKLGYSPALFRTNENRPWLTNGEADKMETLKRKKKQKITFERKTTLFVLRCECCSWFTSDFCINDVFEAYLCHSESAHGLKNELNPYIYETREYGVHYMIHNSKGKQTLRKYLKEISWTRYSEYEKNDKRIVRRTRKMPVYTAWHLLHLGISHYVPCNPVNPL